MHTVLNYKTSLLGANLSFLTFQTLLLFLPPFHTHTHTPYTYAYAHTDTIVALKHQRQQEHLGGSHSAKPHYGKSAQAISATCSFVFEEAFHTNTDIKDKLIAYFRTNERWIYKAG